MKPTADQVIREFDALSSEEKKIVFYNILIKKEAASEFIVGIKPSEAEAINTAVKNIYRRGRSSTGKQKENIVSKYILWKNMLVGFVPNKYLQNYGEMWLIESILGSDIVKDTLRKYRILDEAFIEKLFEQSSYLFYTDHAEKYLLSDNNELFESDFGPLTQLTALNAVQRYGLSMLEESKEKGYVRL